MPGLGRDFRLFPARGAARYTSTGGCSDRREARLPQLDDFLNRFRPAGAPGAATRAGVPADRAAELSAELEPVLGMLAAADAECSRLIGDAKREASLITAQAREQAERIAAEAVRDAGAARSEAVAGVLDIARQHAAQAEQAAAAAVAARSEPDEADVQSLVTAAVALVREMPEGTVAR